MCSRLFVESEREFDVPASAFPPRTTAKQSMLAQNRDSTYVLPWHIADVDDDCEGIAAIFRIWRGQGGRNPPNTVRSALIDLYVLRGD